MAKEVEAFIKLQVRGGQANPSPPVGPALGAKGVNIMEFCKRFNAKTQETPGQLIPVVITVFKDKSFEFITKTTPAAVQLLEAAKLKSGSAESNRNKVGKVTWDQVKAISDTAAALFYGKLFELDPNLKPLFAHADMKEQGKKLMQMIGVAVSGLDALDKLIPAVEDLGRRHVGYGVEEAHYDTVGAALLATLKEGLGESFTPQTEEAWGITYNTLATVMKSAAYTPSDAEAVTA